MRLPFSSRRSRKRHLIWLGLAAAIAGAAAAAVLLIPNTKGGFSEDIRTAKTTSRPASQGAIQAAQGEVPLSASDRAAINTLLDRFVPSAVARRDPAAAWNLVTPNMRQGVTRSEWSRGSIPAFPFDPRGSRFHDWTVFTSQRNDVELDLILQPRHPGKQGTAAYRIDVKKLGGRWLVDWVFVAETHAPETAPTKAAAAAKAQPSDDLKPRLSAFWFIVPAAIGALIVLIPLLVFGSRWLRDRRAARAHRSERMLPPLPPPSRAARDPADRP